MEESGVGEVAGWMEVNRERARKNQGRGNGGAQTWRRALGGFVRGGGVWSGGQGHMEDGPSGRTKLVWNVLRVFFAGMVEAGCLWATYI